MTIQQLETMLAYYRRNRNITMLLVLAVIGCSALFGAMHAWGGVGAMIVLAFWTGFWLVRVQQTIAALRRKLAERIAYRDLRIHSTGIFMRDVQ